MPQAIEEFVRRGSVRKVRKPVWGISRLPVSENRNGRYAVATIVSGLSGVGDGTSKPGVLGRSAGFRGHRVGP